jgi:invasion protein IalB
MIKIMILLAAAVSAPALAQSVDPQATASAPATATQANAPAASATKVSGDDKIVCERHEEIGTRLGGRKVCMTVAQWAEQRRIEREQVEKVQQVVNQNPSH